ncbi:MAG: DNA-3-methyladenine glycosylase I [Piscirickettsiaceae bacterium CG_4_9_14_3_um_filter_43_564]|nr:DNA-3-methyladenine glycosylase I [Thiomicrospira sp.]OIP94867.1 MAG: DNA-3-methyladenine glycosylase [Thiomicrospira sp. CG2_30_44_34]PIQ05931.1 MAG: DNA-3-methyladenine glycosylase I [Piscirickettsiaceae bacterium CG18_big_fil_WC_8_21_14_2_50_44_103]PIU37700.1 MAG: DNA-3-methyladenine glycosylase I [Piscirickettsiaceae bacterium CG07_land_8_20_14_0_80_44_28]PIW57295.1 MAG: DNA-3-methyladenine glycosylase I [Piscirickettsiaceae bacterium CG12_big_fil_rev_8_21_14_0_65_44_934]PIW77405.1 MAG:
MGQDKKFRCFGNQPGHQLYADYHDNEWGVPVYEDNKLFEMLVLEGAQAGLSWETVLKKRDGYRQAFHQFNPALVTKMTDAELEGLRQNPNIIRNRLKLTSARNNARVFLQIQREFGNFASYLWRFVDDRPILNHWTTAAEMPATSAISDAISKDLKKRGMSFVGSTIIYAYMQAVGLVNDHLTNCWRYHQPIKP